MTTPIYLVAPKPHLGQSATLAQRLHDMVVGEELTPATPAITARDHWSLNTTLRTVPFDIWQPLRSRHNFSYTKYSPAVTYGYSRVHTAALFSPQDEILESSRERSVTKPIGSRTPKSTIAPSTTHDHPRPSNLVHTTPPYKVRKTNTSPIFLNEKVLWKLRSLRGSQRQQFKHDRHRSYSSTTRRAQILGL